MPQNKSSRSRGPLVSAHLRGPRGEARGELTNLSISGCAVDVGEDADWKPGQRVLVELKSSILREPLRTLGVCGTSVRGILPLEFADPQQMDRELPHALVSAFNRRGAQRVPVDDEVPVRLRAMAEGGSGHGPEHGATLLDVSVGGLGLRLSPEAARGVAVGHKLALRFAVRGLGHEFALVGRVQSLWPADGFVGCGLHFDPGCKPSAGQQDALLELIARCRADEYDRREAG